MQPQQALHAVVAQMNINVGAAKAQVGKGTGTHVWNNTAIV